MAKLDPFFGPHAGSLQIYVASFSVGSGKFTAFSDYQADFTGSYSFLFQSGNITIAIGLSDQNAASTSGPCKISLNGNTDAAANYLVIGQRLRINTTLNDLPIDVYVSNGGTQVDNVSGHNIWIGSSVSTPQV
jgi:hypothetical protein